MKRLVFDIETVGLPWESLAPSQQEYLLRDAEKEKTQKDKEKKQEEFNSRNNNNRGGSSSSGFFVVK